MNKRTQWLGVVAGLAGFANVADAGPPVRTSVSVGFNIGPPVVPVAPIYRPWPYRTYYVPPPVIVERPIYVAPPPPPPVVYQPAPRTVIVETARPVVYETPAQPSAMDAHLGALRHPEEAVRRNAVLELGRMKAMPAIDSLAASLAGDPAPSVREASARSLGMLGSPRSLTALTHAAQADPDPNVRHSAQFAVDVIRTR